jgi:hypothetical protein
MIDGRTLWVPGTPGIDGRQWRFSRLDDELAPIGAVRLPSACRSPVSAPAFPEDQTMQLRRLSRLAAAGALALAVAGPAVAQGGPGPMMGGERGWGMGWGMWWDGPWGRGPDGMLDRVEGRLAFIKAELKITEAQTPAWNQLADAIRAAAKNHNERMKTILRREEGAKTLPERLEAQESRIAARLDEIRQIKTSLNSLYGVLADAQKKDADDIVLPMTGMHGPMMGGPRWWRD